MRIKYKNWNPRSQSLILITQANKIITEYENNGYVLTLRQLYYQFVARGLIPNTEKSYHHIGSIITNARMAGLISWEAIEDRTRTLNSFWSEEDETVAVRALPMYMRFDQWARQEYYIEVWVEKEALGNVVERACEPLLVPHLACKGYLSASEAWRGGRRYLEKIEEGKKCILIHLGDHDPSGIDMTRDNAKRLSLFSEAFTSIPVTRIALNINQVEKYNPPPNPTKITDSRAKSYIAEYGNTSWELDALEPQVIETLITNEINKYIDQDIWDEVADEQEEKRNLLVKLHDRWDDIKAILQTE